MDLHYDRDCVSASLTGRISPDLLTEVYDALSCYEPGYFYTWKYKHGQWDGKTHFLDPATMSFPAGHGAIVERVLTARGAEFQVFDQRPPPPWVPGTTCPALKDITLDPDQIAATNHLLSVGRGVGIFPTSFGKTEVAAALMAAARPQRAIFLVTRKGLMAQTAERLEARLGERVGRLGGGMRELRQRLTVATIQSLSARLPFYSRDGDILPHQRLLIMDECHTVATEALRVLSRIHAPARFGLSATVHESPRRLHLQAYLGPIVIESSLTDLVATGRAAVPTIVMYRVGGFADETGDFESAYREGIMYNQQRNDLIVRLARERAATGERVLILVWSLDHGRRLQAQLSTRFRRVPFLYGQTDLDTLERTKRQFEIGELPILIASTIFDFGQDVPSITTFIMAAGMRSPLRTIQRLGRSLRRKPTGDNRVTVIDFYDLAHRLLRRQSDERQQTYSRKGYPPTVQDASEALA